ncbi:hypothetical protein DFJ74DRAFT_661746 [Hyaloraphidium curvatum]|nr:hypothetical protein DFJ74DRAFT_661746 [Hyaloraphidium curvatum]
MVRTMTPHNMPEQCPGRQRSKRRQKSKDQRGKVRRRGTVERLVQRIGHRRDGKHGRRIGEPLRVKLEPLVPVRVSVTDPRQGVLRRVVGPHWRRRPCIVLVSRVGGVVGSPPALEVARQVLDFAPGYHKLEEAGHIQLVCRDHPAGGDRHPRIAGVRVIRLHQGRPVVLVHAGRRLDVDDEADVDACVAVPCVLGTLARKDGVDHARADKVVVEVEVEHVEVGRGREGVADRYRGGLREKTKLGLAVERVRARIRRRRVASVEGDVGFAAPVIGVFVTRVTELGKMLGAAGHDGAPLAGPPSPGHAAAGVPHAGSRVGVQQARRIVAWGPRDRDPASLRPPARFCTSLSAALSAAPNPFCLSDTPLCSRHVETRLIPWEQEPLAASGDKPRTTHYNLHQMYANRH